MALRDQPYFPLYVQDYLTDEKLNLCSLSTQGVYIRILCMLHKSETYGGILFKQIPKQNFSSVQYFAWVLSKQINVELKDVEESLEELLFFEVLKIEKTAAEIDFLYQKRMIKDNEISLARSIAGKKGGGNPNLFKQNSKQIDKQNSKQEIKQRLKQTSKQKDKQEGKQNTEYEHAYEYEYESDNNIEYKDENLKKENQKKENDFFEKNKNLTEIPLAECKKIFLQDEAHLETLCINLSLTKTELNKQINSFFTELENRAETSKSLADARRHFATWFNYHKPKQNAHNTLHNVATNHDDHF